MGAFSPRPITSRASPFPFPCLRWLSTCSAVVLPRFGGPDVLQIRSHETLPELGSSQVLVATKAAAVNPIDVRMREGYGRSLFEPLLPLILGRDVSGEVVNVGNAVKQFQLGQQVFGALHPTAVRGTYSDYVILAEDQLVVKPPSLTHMNLKDQLKGRFDAILDTIGVQETEALGVRILKKGGHYTTLQGEAVNYADKFGLIAGGAAAAAALLRKQLQYRQSYGIEYWWTIMRTDAEALEDIARLARDGKMKIPVGKSFSLWEAAEAHRVQEGKQAHGKVVLQLE